MNADLQTQLRTLWTLLDDRGSVVRRRDIEALSDDVVQALCEHEAGRIRALIEGDAAGWHPRPHQPVMRIGRAAASATSDAARAGAAGEPQEMRRCSASTRPGSPAQPDDSRRCRTAATEATRAIGYAAPTQTPPAVADSTEERHAQPSDSQHDTDPTTERNQPQMRSLTAKARKDSR